MTSGQYSDKDIRTQADRRRTFAVISHPDAGKSTTTEALALHARAIGKAGATHGKAGRRATVSDWMKMEQDRGISISSAALQFEYRDAVFNLVDTPGHADFSEDTYRVLSAVDCAVMLIDAAKGLEAQTMKLFEVCAHRNIPIITVINKWDRAGLDALELMDEVQERTGLLPTPLTWPVGQSGDFRGVLDRLTGDYTKYDRTNAGATIAGEETYGADKAIELEGDAWQTAVDESDLLDMEDQNHDQETFLAGKSTPVMFASAVLNFGIHKLLDMLVDLAPAAEARLDKNDEPRDVADPFSGFVFKVQAGMDSNHRDRLAYIRVCSGVFERGSVLTHAATGKPFATKYAQQVFGRDRDVVDEAFPGDVVGLVNASALRVGDSLYLDKKVEFPGIPTFSPEHFMVIRAKDSSKYKQFRRGIEQLDHEGVIQVLRSDLRGDQAPVLGAVGPMQFEVAEDRMNNEFHAPCALERLNFSLARRTTPECVPTLARERSVEVLHRSDGELLALFSDRWRLQGVQKNHPDLVLEPLVVS
ncbi:peptide chain release factor 3 [Brevibacterium aurantiacum]|uniref:peptide chain release factor 3 n=1 Tax=Brevibacterium aurantiacum TaxID=273384 RepID=UPI0018691284|nr:peptide chain release factor 3 [Brevibacterium aurantiacum]